MKREGEEALLRAVVRTAVDGVILIDTHGTVLMFNPACERLFGYAADEVVGRNVNMLMPEPHRTAHDGYLGNYLTTGDAKIIGIGREVEGRRKDGTTFPMDLSVGEAVQDDGPVFVGIIHDLSERQRAEQATREAAARLRAVVDTAVDGVILIDDHGMVMMFNPACEKLFGYRAEEVMGRNVNMLMPSPYREQHDRYLANYLDTGERKIIGIGREVQGRRRDGSTFPMDLSVGEAEQDGRAIFVGIIHDLTERKRTEEQLAQAQKMEAVGQLSGGIAHDFNNLLTVIVGNAELLSERLEGQEELTRFSDMIMGAGERGAELTQRLLAFSRRQTLVPIELDCNRLVETIRKLLQRTLLESIEIESRLEDGIWPAFADAAQLQSAVLNLALNAQDAMPDGGHLTITTANMPLDEDNEHAHLDIPPGRYVMIAVTDDGEGMTPDILERACEPFFTTKEVGKGSGLGLSMVYGFAKQSNGHLTIYSEPGLGTTVRIYLPAAEATGAAMESDRMQPLAAAPRGHGECVLVVEDDPFVRAYAITCVAALGYEVLSAQNGDEAMAKLQSDARVDVLFTDIVMPGGINGWELAAWARQIRPGLRVLLTSGYALETLAARGQVHQDMVILTKPYRKRQLADRLAEVLRKP